MKVQIGDEVRDMTETEFAAHESALQSAATSLAAAEAVAEARARALTKLQALGLTAAEVAALVG